MSSRRSAWSGRSTSSLALTSRWTSLGGGLLMRRIIALDLDQSRDYSLDYDPRADYSLYCDPRSASKDNDEPPADIAALYGTGGRFPMTSMSPPQTSPLYTPRGQNLALLLLA